MSVVVPAPPTAPPSPANAAALERDLRERVDGEVRFDPGSRGAYSTDASNFRQVPIGVVIPRHPDAAVDAIAVCREHRAPVLSRGGGTSLAGQCTNAAVMIDWSKYCHRLESVDAEKRRCVVQPGIVLDELNRQLKPTGLRYGPEPATHPNCTLGGMIGNNSCGATAQRTGKVVDNTVGLDVLLYDGTRFWARKTGDEEYARILAARTPQADDNRQANGHHEADNNRQANGHHQADHNRQTDHNRQANDNRQADIYRRLRDLVDTYGDEIRARFPDIPRRVSGYNLDSLLPEYGFDVCGLLIGSEATLVTVLRAELELVPVIKQRTLVVIGYPTVSGAGDAISQVTPHDPIALEGLDRRLVRDQALKREHSSAIEKLPEGNGWLMVQFGGDTTEESDARAHKMLADLHLDDDRFRFLDDPSEEDELWQAREAGLGATAHVPGHRDTWEGWEDSAVPPERLGDYLRELDALYERYGYVDDSGPALYGHFGHGCVHTRIPFDLYSDDGVAAYRRFLYDAAALVTRYGGSLSGEHGDGQTRGELLPVMFGDRIVEAFRHLKAIFDPDNRMNPGKVVEPYPLDANLRLGGHWHPRALGSSHFSYPDDGGSFAQAANRCVGIGKCRRQSTEGGTVMCPSYQVTLEEEHSTRGRARLLFELLNGHGDGPIEQGWRSQAVHDALDLCLACKGCRSDCPVNVDMATYKAEFLSHYYEGRVRPRSAYALGWLPALARAASATKAAPAINAFTQRPRSRRLMTTAAGLEQRPLPRFAPRSLQQWDAARDGTAPNSTGERGHLLLWPDTFTNFMHPEIGQAAVKVLEHAGWRLTIPSGPLCCGLTWISTGQLKIAKRVLTRTLTALQDHIRAGGLIVGLEPSCTAVFRSDAPELVPDAPYVKELSKQTVTLAELLTQHTPGYHPPDLHGRKALVQVHCHQHAVLGFEADQALLAGANVDTESLESGCCGLAGNFGFEPGHRDVSIACAERVMLPAIRGAPPNTAILADGFSCRTQIEQLNSGGRRATHLVQLLADAL